MSGPGDLIMEALYPILLPLFGFWAFGLLLLLFRRGIGAVYKLSAVFIFAFYALWFLEPTLASLELYRAALNEALPALLVNIKRLFALGLLVLWPVAVFVVFQARSVEYAAGLLRAMVLLTLLFWMFWTLNYFLAPLPMEWLRESLPGTFNIPAIPDPPVNPQ